MKIFNLEIQLYEYHTPVRRQLVYKRHSNYYYEKRLLDKCNWVAT